MLFCIAISRDKSFCSRKPDHKAAALTAVGRIGCHFVKSAYLLDDAPRSSSSALSVSPCLGLSLP